MSSTDPPRQHAIRALLNPAFSPGVLRDRYAARITPIIDGLLDQIIDAGQVEVLSALAYEIPVLVISEMLGVSQADREMFKRWTAQALGLAELEGGSVVMKGHELKHYFRSIIDERRHSPNGEATDLVSLLVHGCPDDGVALNERELLSNCELLLIGGFQTTAHLLAHLFRVLSTFPEIQEQVWQNPTLAPLLIEETLRYFSPFHIQVRRTTREVMLSGTQIPENQLVMTVLSSANRDEAVFARAEFFDLLRFRETPPNHVAFGFRGIHYCLGAPLVRLEANLFLQRLIARLEQIRVVEGFALSPMPTEGMLIPAVNGVQSLPVTFKRR
jgi:cytochrome P450